MYIEKIKVMNMISNQTKNDEREMELVEKNELLLKNLILFFPSFMFDLWERPKLMALLLQNAEINDIKEYLAPLIMNNFYENILSSNFIEENLIYVLTLLLSEEINSLLYVEQNTNFLDGTCCGYLLEELRKKKDIQAFFKNIIIDSIENLEINYSNLKLNFEIDSLNTEFEEETKNSNSKKSINIDKIYLNTKINDVKFDDIINYENRKLMEAERINFNKKYIPPLNKQGCEEFAKNNKIDFNKSLYNLYSSQLDNSSDQKLYSNDQMISNINKYKKSLKLLYVYQNNFCRVIDFIDTIFEKIISNFHLLPYSIKCFSKIIILLVEQKFPEITEAEKIIFFAKFFFGRLLIPILRNPRTEAFISNIIISENTMNNLQLICDIISKFVSGELYTSDSCPGFTPFNWYFIEKSKIIYEIFEHATRVRLPNFIEDFIEDKLPSDYKYDYFQENKDEVINFRSICFNIHQAQTLLNTMDKCKTEIFGSPDTVYLEKSFQKLLSKNSKKIFDEITQKENSAQNTSKLKLNFFEKDATKKRPKLFYFLITSLATNNDYEKLFEISQLTKSFSLKEIKDLSNEENVLKNNIIKVKNFICNLLYNFDKLIKTNFEPGTIETTEKILEELNILMKSPYFVIDGSIPFDWYINSIFEYLKKIPTNLTQNDCEELYKEIEDEINNSLAQLDFLKFSAILEKLDFCERGKIYYKENQNILNDIKLKEEVREIIKNEFIPVKIKFSLNEDEKGVFQIEPSNFKKRDKESLEKKIIQESSKKYIFVYTIENFTKKFPNLIVYEDYFDADIFQIQKNLNFPENIDKYFNIVFNALESNENLKKRYPNMSKIKENIIDYVMSKIHDKIFPVEFNHLDSKIFQRSVTLSWIKPNHFLGNKKQYVFGSFLKDITKIYKQLEIEKSPRTKLLNMDEIFNDISFFYSFNGKDEIGMDEIIPLLSYAMIKIQPLILDSNLKFMKLYKDVGGNKFSGNKFEQLESVMELIINMKFSNLIGVTKEEFSENIRKKNHKKN